MSLSLYNWFGVVLPSYSHESLWNGKAARERQLNFSKVSDRKRRYIPSNNNIFIAVRLMEFSGFA